MDFKAVIQERRSGVGNTREELNYLAMSAANGAVPDYQLSAWLMAECFNPLNADETAWLTLAMAHSGERINLSGLPKPWVDKHSTGGVGDKTSLVLLPLLASCGLTIVKMSGRGLGITGGTVDKLQSVPGFRMDLSPEEMKAQAAKIGLAITGQSPKLAPADKALYALRDVTGTVDSIPLIVSSILSKKIAGGAEIVVLDVKCGSGGFMPDLGSAEKLGRALVETGIRAGLSVHFCVTDMSQPLGRAVGNLLEVKEAVETLKGAPGRFADLCLRLAAHTLQAAGRTASHQEAAEAAKLAIESGRALDKARQWFAAQGAAVDVFGPTWPLADAPIIVRATNPHGVGYVQKLDAKTVGETVVQLGGGRERVSDEIDPRVGVECLKHVGDEVKLDEPVFIVHAASQRAAEEASEKLIGGLSVSNKNVAALPLILAASDGAQDLVT